MGTWGVKPLDGDGMQDWLGDVQNDVEKRIARALKKAKRNPAVARAAAHMIPRAYRCDLISEFEAPALADFAIDVLENVVLESRYMDEWKDEVIASKARAQIKDEIRTLRRFRKAVSQD